MRRGAVILTRRVQGTSIPILVVLEWMRLMHWWIAGHFSKHLQYFYDFVGPSAHSSLVSPFGSPHNDFIGANAVGV